MTERDCRILERFAARVRALYPGAQIWAFGSRVRGGAMPDSDLDIAVVFPGARRPDTSRIRELAWEIGFEHDLILNVFVFSTEDFEAGPMSESTLAQNIRTEGIAVHTSLEDPMEGFIGAFKSNVPDWADQHDQYLGHEAMKNA